MLPNSASASKESDAALLILSRYCLKTKDSKFRKVDEGPKWAAALRKWREQSVMQAESGCVSSDGV